MIPRRIQSMLSLRECTRDRVEEDGVIKLIPNMDYRDPVTAAAYVCKIQDSFEYLRVHQKLVIKPVIVEKQ